MPQGLRSNRLDSSANPVPVSENYCLVMLCIPKPVPHTGQGVDDAAVAWYVNVFTYECNIAA